MHYVLVLGLVLGLMLSSAKAWDCSPHLLMMQIALKDLTADETSKLERILGGMTEKDASGHLLEAACFSEDMTASGFTALELWKSYETPFYDGISEKDAHFHKPLMDSLFAIVRL